MTRNIDELSNLTTRAVEPEKYFGEMDLNEEQVDRRLKYTKKANELFDVILILLMTMRDNGTLDYVYARDMLESWLLSLIAEFTTPDDYLIDYATDTAYNFIDTTKNHIDEPWYTSSDRSLFNAENSANDVMNYSEYIDALHSGKTEKRWITEQDNRVRKTHKAVTKKPIPIKDLFHVGFALMRFPKDYDLAEAFPEELINCRCTIEYLPKEDEKREIHISASQISSRKNPTGIPPGVALYGDNLNSRQLNILSYLQKYDDRMIFDKKKVSMKDLAALTAHENVEFAMFTRKNKRYIIRGGIDGCNISENEALQLAKQGYKWSGHTHPGTDYAVNLPSGDDRYILRVINQKYSMICSSTGRRYVFAAEGGEDIGQI